MTTCVDTLHRLGGPRSPWRGPEGPHEDPLPALWVAIATALLALAAGVHLF